MIKLSPKILTQLSNSKNLLAFSAGVDSTALFFILVSNDIKFDIAIVNHNLRDNSKKEIDYAKDLSCEFSKKIYIKDLYFNSNSNLESRARKLRYDFFESIILEHDYDTLITAHQLDDQLEWFFMQLSKGSGLLELLGMSDTNNRHIKNENFIIQKKYKLIRPLLEYSKKSLIEYLDNSNIKYFVDESNFDIKFKRNYFRKKFTNEFLSEFEDGVRRSFEYLKYDASLSPKLEVVKQLNKYIIYENQKNHTNKLIDRAFKEFGILLSKAQRDEIQRTKDCVIGSRVTIFFDNDFIHIAPYIKCVIPKKVREEYRLKRIPPKIRGYIYSIRGDKI